MDIIYKRYKSYKNIIRAILVFAFSSSFGFWILFNQISQIKQDKIRDATITATNIAYSIEKELLNTITTTKTLEVLVENDPSFKNFDEAAQQLFEVFDGLVGLQLAPNGKISRVYPYEKFKTAIGSDLLINELTALDATKAVITKKLTLAGPYDIVQGGFSMVARNPVFIGENNDQFWGFTIAIIDFRNFIEKTNLQFIDKKAYQYQLWRESPDSNDKIIFISSDGDFLNDDVVVKPITVPNGEWYLSILPVYARLTLLYLALAILFILIFSAILSYLIYRIYNSNRILISQSEELRENERQLTSSNNTKQKLLSLMAHDIRGPIGAIHSISQFLKTDNSNLTSFQQESIDHINKTAFSTHQLLNNLLEWAKTQNNDLNAKPQAFDLKSLINDVKSVLNTNLEMKNIVFDTQQIDENEFAKAWADKGMIETVLRNLISNSIKFTPVNGTISIHITRTEVNYFTVIINDTGVGIPAEKVANLFISDQIESTNGTMNEKGNGLGLSMCKEFVTKNNGKIWAESQVGKGSTFYFTIPVELN